MSMIEQLHRCLRTSPPHVRITKWRLSYSEAMQIANEFVKGDDDVTWRNRRSTADIMGSMMDGTAKLFGIPIELKLVPGQAYPIEPQFIGYSQPSWLRSWLQ